MDYLIGPSVRCGNCYVRIANTVACTYFIHKNDSFQFTEFFRRFPNSLDNFGIFRSVTRYHLYSADLKSRCASLRTYSFSRNQLGAGRILPIRSLTFFRISVRSFTPCLRKKDAISGFVLSVNDTATLEFRSSVPKGTSSSTTKWPDSASDVA